MPLTHHRASDYSYPIREIVDIANLISPHIPVPIRWENIGDPVSRGHKMPEWMLEIICKTLPEATGYCPTRGVEKTREFLAERHNQEPGPVIQAKDILFFNGLGDAIASLMSVLSPKVRMILPEPGYPSYSTLESLRCESLCLKYELSATNDWQMDLEDLENKLKNHPEIRLLLLLQPSNPLGTLLNLETMRSLAELARKYSLIVISDEIYREHVFEPEEFVSWQAVAEDLPSILLKGISKDLPWPGARCGWMEFLNCQHSEELTELQKVLEKKKMLEVCATTLPQLVIPKLFSDPRLMPWYEESNRFYAKRQNLVQDMLTSVPGVQVIAARAAFYTSVLIPSIPLCDLLHPPFTPELNLVLAHTWETASLDTRFCLWLLIQTGICLVPLSSFGGRLQGFRMTVLQKDETLFELLLNDLKSSLKQAQLLKAA